MVNYIGCSGWNYEDWRIKFYPKNLSKNKWLEFYAKNFLTLEVNSTFYRLPKENTIRKWRNQVPENFKFSLKLSRFITHAKRFTETQDAMKNFYKIVLNLDKKLGVILIQLPANFKYSKENLQKIIISLSNEFTHSIEFRHETWLNENVIHQLHKNRIILCSHDYDEKFSHIQQTSADLYLRLHGPKELYSSNYTKAQRENYIKEIKKLKYHNLWVYFNNDVNAYAPANALSFIKKLSRD